MSLDRAERGRRRPNILVISTDQQFAGVMSCAGNLDLHTPAMDSLARGGIRFDRAYCSNPICVPSRASYMTGLMPHETGIRYNGNEFDQVMEGQCLAKDFQDAGYDSGHVGKWHIPRSLDDRAWSGFDYLAARHNTRVDREIPEAANTFLRKNRGESSRTPVIISWKGRTVTEREEKKHLLNLGTDLAPTLLDFAGIAPRVGLRGDQCQAARVG